MAKLLQDFSLRFVIWENLKEWECAVAVAVKMVHAIQIVCILEIQEHLGAWLRNWEILHFLEIWNCSWKCDHGKKLHAQQEKIVHFANIDKCY